MHHINTQKALQGLVLLRSYRLKSYVPCVMICLCICIVNFWISTTCQMSRLFTCRWIWVLVTTGFYWYRLHNSNYINHVRNGCKSKKLISIETKCMLYFLLVCNCYMINSQKLHLDERIATVYNSISHRFSTLKPKLALVR